MNTVRLALILATAAVCGCTTTRPPSDVAHLQLESDDSPTVMVSKIGLERKNGVLVVWGYVLKRIHATDTTKTHLDVALYDDQGRLLRSTVEHFQPRQIDRCYRRPDFATYRIGLDPLPERTSRITVRAHDGAEDHP